MTSVKELNENVMTKYVDTETGEVKTGYLIDPTKYEIISRKSKDNSSTYFSNKIDIDNFDGLAGRFTFTVTDSIKKLNNDERFSNADKTRIIFLGTYVSYDKNYLIYDNGKPVLKNHLKELLRISNKKQFYTFYNKLVDSGIIEEYPESKRKIHLKWNREYSFKGKASSRDKKESSLIKTFDRQVRELFQEKDENDKPVHTPNNLYMLFMLLPFIQPESNMLCECPEAGVNSKPMTVQEVATLFGYKRTYDFKRKIMSLKLKGFPVIAIISSGEYSHVVVNPYIVYKSGKAPNESLVAHFRDTQERLFKKRYR